MIGFGIDRQQAEFVADIKLRNINREYILRRTQEVEELEREIAELDAMLQSEKKLRGVIVKELNAIAEKYGEPRRTGILYDSVSYEPDDEPETPDYPVSVFVSREGYFKKSRRNPCAWPTSRSSRRATACCSPARRRTRPS